MNVTHVDLPGNSRPAKKGSIRLSDADPTEVMSVTVVVRGKQELPEPDPMIAPMSIDEIEQNYGATQGDIDLVSGSLANFGLKTIDASAGSRTVELEGTVSQMESAFSVELGRFQNREQGEYRGREGGIRVPAELSGIVTAVLGLDERQVAKRHPLVPTATAASPEAGNDGPQGPSDLEARYSFPAGNAAGQTIGILEFGGGYWEADLQMYCQQISQRAQPQVTVVPVGLQSLSLAQIEAMTNQQQKENEFDAAGEVNMDIQVVAGFCPGAQIQVYFAPFTQKGWVNVLKKAVHTTDGPDVITVSWGSAEDSGDYTPAAITAINNMLKTAALAGVTICVSSGDDGAGDTVNDGLAHCDFPSSSPYVLAVGGTMFPAGEPETGWWDAPGARTSNGGGSSTGGRSTVFPTPSWQDVSVVSVRTGQPAGRCVPDVSALSGEPMYNLIFAGKVAPNGGTSASAPLWASLLARIGGNLPAGQTVGFLTPRLYQAGPDGNPLGTSVATDITTGNNNDLADPSLGLKAVTGYEAGPGYDAVTGWGVPNGTALWNALQSSGSVASSLFASLTKGALSKTGATEPKVTHDPYAAILIDHNSLDEMALKQSMLESSERSQPWTDIPFPAGTAPIVLADSPGPALPTADVVLITYTTDEANAMAAVLTPGFLAVPPRGASVRAWTSYTNLYSSYIPDLLPGSSPALDSHNLGLYKLIQIGTKRVLCFKSSLHLARDGKSIPIMRLTQQIQSETGAGLMITTGTAGGIGAAVQLGDASITTGCKFDLIRMFASEPFNGTTVTSTFELTDPSYLALANSTLIPINAGRLKSAPIPPDRTPMIMSGGSVFGGEPNICVTTDGFLYDDAENTYHLQGLGCMVEMDDAVIGLAVQQIPSNPPKWLSIRNASDPQMPAGATQQESSDIYMDYGFYTTFSSVLACWACVLGS